MKHGGMPVTSCEGAPTTSRAHAWPAGPLLLAALLLAVAGCASGDDDAVGVDSSPSERPPRRPARPPASERPQRRDRPRPQKTVEITVSVRDGKVTAQAAAGRRPAGRPGPAAGHQRRRRRAARARLRHRGAARGGSHHDGRVHRRPAGRLRGRDPRDRARAAAARGALTDRRFVMSTSGELLAHGVGQPRGPADPVLLRGDRGGASPWSSRSSRSGCCGGSRGCARGRPAGRCRPACSGCSTDGRYAVGLRVLGLLAAAYVAMAAVARPRRRAEPDGRLGLRAALDRRPAAVAAARPGLAAGQPDPRRCTACCRG